MNELKPGWKTSEFASKWVAAIAMGGYGIQDEDPRVRAAALIAVAIMFAAYAISRGKEKGKSMKALIITLPLLLASCGSTSLQRDPSTGAPVLVDKETGQITPLPNVGTTAGTVIGAVTGNPGIGLAVGGLITALMGSFVSRKRKAA